MARHWRPFLIGWAWTAALALLLYAFVRYLVPAADEMLQPVYWFTLIPGLVGTWRWLRPRGSHDRRTTDRRHAARRAPTDEEPDEPPDR